MECDDEFGEDRNNKHLRTERKLLRGTAWLEALRDCNARRPDGGERPTRSLPIYVPIYIRLWQDMTRALSQDLHHPQGLPAACQQPNAHAHNRGGSVIQRCKLNCFRRAPITLTAIHPLVSPMWYAFLFDMLDPHAIILLRRALVQCFAGYPFAFACVPRR